MLYRYEKYYLLKNVFSHIALTKPGQRRAERSQACLDWMKQAETKLRIWACMYNFDRDFIREEFELIQTNSIVYDGAFLFVKCKRDKEYWVWSNTGRSGFRLDQYEAQSELFHYWSVSFRTTSWVQQDGGSSLCCGATGASMGSTRRNVQGFSCGSRTRPPASGRDAAAPLWWLWSGRRTSGRAETSPEVGEPSGTPRLRCPGGQGAPWAPHSHASGGYRTWKRSQRYRNRKAADK